MIASRNKLQFRLLHDSTKEKERVEDRKKTIRRLIQHTAYANRITEEEIHKRLLEVCTAL